METKPPSNDWDSTSLNNEWKHFEKHVKLMFLGPLAGKTKEWKCTFFSTHWWRKKQHRHLPAEIPWICCTCHQQCVYPVHISKTWPIWRTKHREIHHKTENPGKGLELYLCWLNDSRQNSQWHQRPKNERKTSSGSLILVLAVNKCCS